MDDVEAGGGLGGREGWMGGVVLCDEGVLAPLTGDVSIAEASSSCRSLASISAILSLVLSA